MPVIGMGGICNAEDALEFILAGATAVSIGTANLHNPYATVATVDGIGDWRKGKKMNTGYQGTDRRSG